jgi:hypothetical protein
MFETMNKMDAKEVKIVLKRFVSQVLSGSKQCLLGEWNGQVHFDINFLCFLSFF